MRERIDAKSLLETANIVSVIERHVILTKKGREYVGICPFHDDHRKSLQVNEHKQVFKCFACGSGGDAVAFLMLLGRTFKDACEEIASGTSSPMGPTAQRPAQKSTKMVAWAQVKTGAPRPENFTHYRHGQPSKVWEYTDPQGNVLGYICRFDPKTGKEVLPYIYAGLGAAREWRWQGFDRPRPLYGLHRLAANPDAVVMVVEGEKTADAAQILFPDAVVTTWQGGAKAMSHTDWTPIHGRKVILWPDNDTPGVEAMQDIADIIRDHCPVVRYVTNPPNVKTHWDLADATWTPAEARAHFRANSGEVPPRSVKEPETEPEPEPEPVYDIPPPPADLPQETAEDDGNPFFRFLGFTKDGTTLTHQFFCYGSHTIVSLTASSMSKNNLIQMAPINWWEAQFPQKRGFDSDAAVNWLVRTSNSIGTFSLRYLRGRGAWVDGKQIVIHAGNRLVVDNVITPLGGLRSRYVYEASEELGFQIQNPVGAKQAARLLEIIKMLNWEREISAYLLAGWCVIAPLCGALSWRPHIWVTGAAGTGKSWVFKNIVRKLMDNIALAVQGETSEAGLRQMLGHDALPVVFDEAEGEDKRSQERMQSVLSLMRAASADDGGVMAKGTAGGSAITFRIRSCFAFASIAVQIAQHSDRTRVTVLGLKKNDSDEGKTRWEGLQVLHHEVMTQEFIHGLQARSIKLLPVILDNARTFAAAAAIVIGEQRAGDQLGAMLAGAYSLHNDKRISLDDAITWLKSRDLDEERSMDKTRDEIRLLSYLMEQMTTVEGNSGKFERNIGELVAIAAFKVTDTDILPEAAHNRIRRLGFKIDGDFLAISNTASWITTKLSGTPWAKNHHKILQRIEGARTIDSVRFGSGVKSRGVGLPVDIVFDK